MLPTHFQDFTALMEVATETWRSVLTVAGESGRVNGDAFTHAHLRESLNTLDPGKELLDALEVIHELGTEVGREGLHQAALDQQVALNSCDDEPARELAARVWIESRTHAALAEVLVRARVALFEAGHQRTFREFVGKGTAAAAGFDRTKLEAAIAQWCQEHQKSEAVEIYTYQRGTDWFCEVLRGEPLKRLVEIRDRRPAILNFRPAASDLIRYDPQARRLSIATRAASLVQMYRGALGTLFASDAEFFAGEDICSLKPLQQHGRRLFEQHRVAGVLHVDVVELQWRRGDRDRLSVRGRDCFQILEDLGTRLNEGELIEAKLDIVFSGVSRRGRVVLKVPNRIDIKAGVHESLVEQLLDEVGIRGSFGAAPAPSTLWDLYPWRMVEGAWRALIGGAFDRLVQDKTLRPVTLESVAHPNHPSVPGALTVIDLDPTTVVGVSEDPAIGLRTLTPTDVGGFSLDLARLAQKLSTVLTLDGCPHEIAGGLWSLGRRSLSPGVSLAIVLAVRSPSAASGALIREECRGARAVLLVPPHTFSTLDLPQVPCRLPDGPFEEVMGHVIEKLGLQNEVHPLMWLGEDLILDCRRGIAWYRGIELSKLQADTHPFKFAVAVARAVGRSVSTRELNQLLSPQRPDNEAAKSAKADFFRAVKASFAAAGAACPSEVTQIFVANTGGYALRASARVLE